MLLFDCLAQPRGLGVSKLILPVFLLNVWEVYFFLIFIEYSEVHKFMPLV